MYAIRFKRTHADVPAAIFLFLLAAIPIGCGRSSNPATAPVANQPQGPSGSTVESLNKSARTTPSAELRVYGQVPEFELIDQAGNAFGRADLAGKVWVGTFIFTRCGATCPIQTAAMAELQQAFARTNDLGNVQLVSFTVDPAFDTPGVLTEYGRTARADFDHWHFLTGERGALWDLSSEGFKLKIESGRDETNLISHSQFLILVDHQANIRGYYDGLSPQATDKIRQDANQLLKEQFPEREDKIAEISVPKDVRDPQWLQARAAAQRANVQQTMASEFDVFCGFQFTDQLAASGITFKDNVVDDVKQVFKAAHYDHGSAVAVADVDGDGRLDVYFVCQLGANELWRNLGDGRFENITETAGVAVADEVSTAASFADIDNDGDADLYVSRVRAANRLFINNGQGVFTDGSQDSGLDHIAHSSGSVFFDYDRDGLLDLLLTNVGKYTTDERSSQGYYLAYKTAFTGHLHADRSEANILFRNLGNGKFENVNEQLGFNDLSWSGDATAIDGNDDGWPDIYLLNMQGHDQYYENQQGKGFVSKGRELFPASAWGTMGVKVFDFNRDQQLDLFVTDMHTDMVHDVDPGDEKLKMKRNLPIAMLATDGNHILGNAFYRKDGANQYSEVSDQIGAENLWPWGISVADLNADGFEDVFIAASMNYDFRYAINSVLLNDQGKRFIDSEFILGVEPRAKGTAQHWMELDCDGADSDHELCDGRTGKILVWGATGTRSSVVFDIEGDGDLDIITNDFGGVPMVLVSDLSQQRAVHYLSIELVGTSSNRDGLGAMIQVRAAGMDLLAVHDGKSGYLSQSRMPMYVGLGAATEADEITVTWPSGIVQVLPGPIAVDRKLTIVETGESDRQLDSATLDGK